MSTSVVEQLTYVYTNLEFWHTHKLSEEAANEYHKRLLMQGNIITVVDDKDLLGYIEVWKINYEQLGRLLCGVKFYVYDEDIGSGNIAYISNMYIVENLRHSDVYKRLYTRFLERYGDCSYIASKRTKHSDKFTVYPMSKIRGELHGE